MELLSIILLLIGILLIIYFLPSEIRRVRKDVAFYSDKEAIKELVEHIDILTEESREPVAAHTRRWQYLCRFEKASAKWHTAVNICIKTPRPTDEEIASANLAAKELIAMCQEGIGAGYDGMDCEKIMAKTIHCMNMIKEGVKFR